MVKYGDAVYAPIIADGEADVVVAFEKIEALRWLKLLKAGGTLIVNDNEILPIPVKMGKASYPHDAIEQLRQTVEHVCPIRATELAQQLGTIRVASIILLGALVKKLGLEQYDWTALICRKVPAKFLEANLKAYQVGLQSVSPALSLLIPHIFFLIFPIPCKCAPGPPRRVRICAAKFYMGKCWNFHPDMV